MHDLVVTLPSATSSKRLPGVPEEPTAVLGLESLERGHWRGERMLQRTWGREMCGSNSGA